MVAFLDSCFPGAACYRARTPDEEVLCESDAPFFRFPYRERHLQCVWADDRLRPRPLTTTAGENVEVEHPGDWNLEAGPDFANASLRIGRGKEPLQGDLEIHLHPTHWLRHGHDRDRRYKNVRFHVVYFPGPEIPGLIQIPLKPALDANPVFSFDSIDLTAYPHRLPDGDFPLRSLPPEEKRNWLERAGAERLRLKAERFRKVLGDVPPRELLWRELMVALGYKHNKEPFGQLAERLPASLLMERASSPTESYAHLLGMAGLLPDPAPASWPLESRQFIRLLWDVWWPQDAEIKKRALRRSDWTLSGLRPANRPERRLMAAAHYLFRLERLAETSEGLDNLPATFWDTHTTWRRRGKAGALVGPSRLAAIVVNVLIPFRAALGSEPIDLSRLPVESLSGTCRRAAYALFGPDHSPKLYRSALARQGLLQISCDYLLPRRIEELKRLVGIGGAPD